MRQGSCGTFMCVRPSKHPAFLLAAVVGAMILVLTAAWGTTAEQEAKLLPDDGTDYEGFGSSVAFDGDTAVIGAKSDDANGDNSGSAYVFIRSEGAWTQQAKLLPADGASEDYFGESVALDGDTAVIGARFDDDSGMSSGSAYVFTRTGGVWAQSAKLLPADGEAGDLFGAAVALDDDTLVIGASRGGNADVRSGSAYVFTRNMGVWTQQSKLLPADGTSDGLFGVAVALDSDTALIGDYLDDDNGEVSGSAYVFTRSEGVWAQQAKLLPADGTDGDYFSWSVGLDGDTAVIGAPWDENAGVRSGSAYVFTRDTGVWTQQAKLLPANGWAGSFGRSVALDGQIAVIGAIGDNFYDTGSAYLFVRTGSLWVEQVKMPPCDGWVEDYFGYSVALEDDTAVIGAALDNHNGSHSGSAYIFRFTPADADGYGCDADVDVCSSGCDFTSIQDAVDASGSGDTIQLGPGTFFGDVSVAHPRYWYDYSPYHLTIRGAGADVTVVNGGIDVRYARVALSNMTIQGAVGCGLSIKGYWADCSDCPENPPSHRGRLGVEEVMIQDNGCGMEVGYYSDATIAGSTIRENEGHGIQGDYGSHSFWMQRSTINGNGGYGINLDNLDRFG